MCDRRTGRQQPPRFTGLVGMNSDLGACRRSPKTGIGAAGSRRGRAGEASRDPTLPGGTVTCAFTDIEASTLLVRRLGDRYAEVLSEHRRIIRDTFHAADGVEIDRQGDAFFFAFPRARDAVAAAVEAQRAHARRIWPENAPVRVRIGIHTGEPTVGDEGYFGIDVVKAARICGAARGGQILVSETTRALAAAALPEGAHVFQAGERHLKDMDAPESVYVIGIDGAGGAGGDGTARRHLPIPAGWESDLEEQVGKLGTRLLADIGGRVAGSLGGLTGHRGSTAVRPMLGGEDLEDLAGRAVASLETRLRCGASAAALKAAHLARLGPRADGLRPDHG